MRTRSMTFSSCLTDEDDQLVIDASVAVNLLASGRSLKILELLGRPIFVSEPVVSELEEGERLGYAPLGSVSGLVNAQLLQVMPLSGHALDVFVRLVSGSATDTLGDGEAATVALAVSHELTAVIDERKASRVSSQYRGLRLATTIDLFASSQVAGGLGRASLAAAVAASLSGARMQVRETQFEWVWGLIGAEAVGRSPSLKRLSRRSLPTSKARSVG